ncbi:MAG: penicillin-binding protein 2 [Actinomycetales bacterium]|nr:penicillin-binding protein 2 [Actinomycetales bacterium]
MRRPPARTTRRAGRRPPHRPLGRGADFRPGDPVRRLRAWQLFLLLLLTIVAGRVIDLQAIQGPSLAAAGDKARLRTVVLPAVRGDITDVTGVPLATTVAAKNVTVDQTLVKDAAGEAAQLAAVLGGDASVYQSRMTGTRRFVYLAKGITPELWAKVAALSLPGVFSEVTSTRVYPAGSVAANVVGYVRADGHGGSGLEYGFDKELAGTPGSQSYQSSAGGTEIPTADSTSVDPVPGMGIRLTIDRDMQWVAQDAIAKQVAAAKADSGTVVVMDPRTGQIYALATVPTFDPNKPASAAQSDIANRAVSDVFEPGSTSKIMTMSAVIEERKAGPLTRIVVPPVLRTPYKTWHDDVPHGTLHLTLNGVLARSSNIGTILAAQRIGGPKLYSYLKKFGIGVATGLHFPGESRGYVPPPSKWSATSFGTIAFGQGLSLTAVQAASVYATIANDGVRVSPTLVAGYTSPDGTYQPAAAPTSVRVVSPSTATQVRSMLESVVSEDGTAPKAAIAGYRVAGKTGTANRIDDTCGCYRGYTASFIGMAPADAPRLVVAVFLQNPRNGHFGGQLAGPVFKKVMTFSLEHLRIPPTGTVRPRIPVFW